MAPRITHVSSRDNPLLVRLRRQARHPGDYRKHGEVLLEGEHLCEVWRRHGKTPVSTALVAASAWSSGEVPAAAMTASVLVVVADPLMAGIGSLDTPASIACLVPLPPPPPIRPDLASVVLDRLQDAGNVGSILRSAAAFGVRQVLALRGTALLWSPKVLRAAMGAHATLQLVEGLDEAALDGLSVPLLGTSSHAGRALSEVALPWPSAWVLGNEGEGVSPSLQARCALQLRIPQPGGEESLNVGAAAAICLYESSRQRPSS